MTSSIQPNIQQVLDKVKMKQIFRKLDGFCSICRQDHNGRKMDGSDILKVASRETACLLLKQIPFCEKNCQVFQILIKTLISRKVLSTASIKRKASPCVGWLVYKSVCCVNPPWSRVRADPRQLVTPLLSVLADKQPQLKIILCSRGLGSGAAQSCLPTCLIIGVVLAECG